GLLIDARSLTNHDAAESVSIATDPDATSPRHAASPANRSSKFTPGSLGPIAPSRLFLSPDVSAPSTGSKTLSRLRRIARTRPGCATPTSSAGASAAVPAPSPTGGQFWTPIRGQFWTPIDTSGYRTPAGTEFTVRRARVSR